MLAQHLPPGISKHLASINEAPVSQWVGVPFHRGIER